MTASTDIKWFRFTNTGAPQLSNDWGVMIPLLDACLVTGFSDQLVVGVAINQKVVTLTFETQHKYLQYQVIRVSGAEVEEVNGLFRILTISADGLSLTYELEQPSVFTTTGGYIFAKLESLGWEKAFEGVEKAAYRSTNASLNTRPYLRVIDGLPSNYGSLTNNYAKYARVGIVEEMTSIDNMEGVQAPYDSTLPDKNWDTVMSGTTAYAGWCKWFWSYHESGLSSNYAQTHAPTNGNRDWILVGDSDRFYIFMTPFVNSPTARSSYGFGGYDTFIKNDYSNTFLAADLYYHPATTSLRFAYRNTNLSHNATNYSQGMVLQRAYNQIAQYSTAVLVAPEIGRSGVNSPFAAANSYATIVPFPTYIRDSSNYVRGNMPNYYWLGQHMPANDLEIFVNNKDEIMMFIGVSSYYSSNYGQVCVKLGDV